MPMPPGIQINQFLVIVIAIAYCKFLKQLLLLLIAIAGNNYCQQYLLRNIAIFIARYCKILVTMGIIIKKYPDQVIYLGQRLRNTPLSTLRERDEFQSVFRNTDFGRIFTFFKKYSTIHPFAIRTLIWGLLGLVRCRSTIITPCYDFFRKILKSGFEGLFRLQ